MKNDNFSEHVTLQVMSDGTTMGPMSPPTIKGLLINYLYIKKPAEIHVTSQDSGHMGDFLRPIGTVSQPLLQLQDVIY